MENSSWIHPKPEIDAPSLVIYNSLTKTKVPFIPRKGKVVTWYTCGPTVYDAAHLGHARNYMTFDFLRRIMEDYFNYEIYIVMNITDIDDKIIIRGRQNHLFTNKKASVSKIDQELIDFCKISWKNYVEKNIGPISNVEEKQVLQDWSAQFSKLKNNPEKLETEPKFPMYINTTQKALDALIKAEDILAKNSTGSSKQDADSLLDDMQDVVSLYLDKHFGNEVTDPSVFRTLTQYWENDFMQDMQMINVKKPDVLTRVTEFVPEIISFVEKIISNGYAYESNGSVYFAVNSFDGQNGHCYAKLEPKSKGNQALMEEGEGSLGSSLAGKKNTADFALWKASKPGEPAWDSPWGKGRPGWHIECSVMASEILGEQIDIHSGGIDLTFPHHDNELAQSEAHFESNQWINYFMHAGHLHIEGSKMSKSLKNFISIKEALQKYTARQIRLCFLQQRWDAPSDFKHSSMEEALSVESTISNFFANSEGLYRKYNSSGTSNIIGGVRTFLDPEKDLVKDINEAKNKVHLALCDSFDTPTAMRVILGLINRTNVYLRQRLPTADPNPVFMAARYVSKMVRIFGLSDSNSNSTIGWNESNASNSTASGNGVGGSLNISALSNENVVMPYLDILSNFRDAVRLAAKGNPVNVGELLKICDNKLLAKLEAGKTLPEDMFRVGERATEFSEFDEDGIPTKDNAGAEITKSRRKKLVKEWETQKKLHADYLKHLEKSN
ncbi:hypothetical protein BB558_005827 [Smittium angustum]|uniref:cysteine--tRNA ligase n=1 Tax=Smittium angustum TaxID=133377 RepID=A0A2U1IZG5_SMIAN|nr:hypothetical protein BB558_005827 [Smittium angustum]